MQTFLPYPSFAETAAVLDPKRLGNQCYRETLTLVRGGWPAHPASRMWRGHQHALAHYGFECAAQLRNPTTRERWMTFYDALMRQLPNTGLPPWLGDPRIHASHRANLLRKNPDHYAQFGWTEHPQSGYVWPTDLPEYKDALQ